MIALIVAYAANRVIGCRGRIPWDIEGEKKRFRELTTGNIVIMGRRTYEEIGFPLPNRVTIVVSSTKVYDEKNCYTAKSLLEAFELGKSKAVQDNVIRLRGNDKEQSPVHMYVSGGERLYRESLDYVEKMYVTEIDTEVEGDTFFPEFVENEFDKIIQEHVDGDIPYSYVTYIRKK